MQRWPRLKSFVAFHERPICQPSHEGAPPRVCPPHLIMYRQQPSKPPARRTAAALQGLLIRIVLATRQPSRAILDRVRCRIITFRIPDIIGFEFSKLSAGMAHLAAHHQPVLNFATTKLPRTMQD